ncbi:MAG TPA: AtpZ/AtpI family protein [Bacillales bacterium]|nr:AtpZ/AtpI family protein [Bacillales bacterium]
MSRNTEDPWRMTGLLGTLGLEITGCIVGGAFLGRYLDARFGTDPVWLAVCLIAGLLLGILSALYTLKTFVKE